MKGRIFMALFALPFAGVGVWMLWSVGTMLSDAWRSAIVSPFLPRATLSPGSPWVNPTVPLEAGN